MNDNWSKFDGHTPGPWKHDHEPGADECFIWPGYADTDSQWDVIIAEVVLRNGRKDSTDAKNAALIAASPMLLARVRELESRIDTGLSMLQAIIDEHEDFPGVPLAQLYDWLDAYRTLADTHGDDASGAGGDGV